MSRTFWQSEFPVGDPFGGPAYGRREDPVTALIAASAAVKMVGDIQQGRAAKAAGDFNSTVATQNAGIAREQAKTLAEQQQRENYLRLGAINAAQGKSGGVAGEGSVIDVIGDAASQGELQKQQTLYGGELHARDYTNTGMLEKAQGKQAQKGSYFQAAGDLLQGGASYYSSGLLKRGGGPSSTASVNSSNMM